ncbi:FAD:protein FMN transferase [Vibrio sp.]|uniref:FAD:protein FMN transferase n=1 Tax=Vibrio viridaestus TaxID=2487322 RepID=A0A3N9TJ13_9VIBR|nr:FAD:protein FMN transferase [Vibrio viridaestus]MDC0609922.1 FAD:protein FMN transferase [Vibrio sp.]RQW63914.1 FAD:protein FMN transferase [Vibrio viridaestus]
MGCERAPEQMYITGSTMGTTYNIKYISPEGNSALSEEKIKIDVDKVLDEVNNQMSTYRNDSELSSFNQFRSTEPFTVSPALVTVMQEAIRLNTVTEGALDVTVGPLVNLWGFGPNARPEKVPTDEQLELAKERVGIQYLKVDSRSLSVSKTVPDLYVDLSTIAKGWGVDLVAALLENRGIQNYLIEIGGEIRTKGVSSTGSMWRIAIEKPDTEQRAVQELIQPGDLGMATSGDYRNYFEQDGVRYSHIIDPSTGRPIDNKVASVTVLHASAMTADGLATGLMVLGEKRAMQVAERLKIPVLMIVKSENGFEEVSSTTFQPFLVSK